MSNSLFLNQFIILRMLILGINLKLS